jgi:Fe-S cluster assembly iron-binding protein IscA
MAFQITSSAAQELVAAAARSDAAGMALRIAARSTPDGLEYGMGFDEAAPDDQVLVFGELTVLLAAASQPWLAAGGCPPTSCGSGGGCSRCGG